MACSKVPCKVWVISYLLPIAEHCLPFFFLSLHPSISPTMSLGITTDPCLSMLLSRLTAKLQLCASCVCLQWHMAMAALSHPHSHRTPPHCSAHHLPVQDPWAPVAAALGLGLGRRRRCTWGSQGLLRCSTHWYACSLPKPWKGNFCSFQSLSNTLHTFAPSCTLCMHHIPTHALHTPWSMFPCFPMLWALGSPACSRPSLCMPPGP